MVETGTGAGETAARKSYDPDIKKNFIPIVLVGVTIIGAAVAAGLVVGLTGRMSEMTEYAQQACDESRPTALDINVCMQADCYFDVSSCEIECPFGFKSDSGDCEASCECAIEGVYQGDIVFGRDELSRLAKAYGMTAESDFAVFSGSTVVKEKLWNQFPENGRYKVYYEITKEIPNESTGSLLQTIEFFSQKTCIDFSIRHQDEMPYFLFGTGKGCASAVGYASHMQDQTVSLDDGCFTQETIKHQLLHLLGFEHEQARPDRDSYVRILEENILPNKRSNFMKLSREQIGSLTSAYDLESILHFGSKSFSRNGQNTIVLRDSGDIIPQATDTSKGDIEEVNLLYGCLEKSPGQWSMWDEWGTCDVTCGSGSQPRFRRCEDADGNLVESCAGSQKEFRQCDVPCEVTKPKGTVAGVDALSDCDASCGGGEMLGRYICDPPDSECGESTESSNGLMYLPCNTEPCRTKTEEFHLWKKWGKWSECSVTCGGGTRRRSRRCLSGGQSSSQCIMQDGAKASIEFHKEPCNTEECVGGPPKDDGAWVAWEACSATCDGIRRRYRLCVQIGECERTGNDQSEPCNTGVCQVPGPQALNTEPVDVSAALCPPNSGSVWQFGDFNGDGREDPLCAHGSDDMVLAHTGPQGAVERAFWKGKRGACAGRIHVGDFNGDGRADMLCRDVNLGKLTIKLASRDGGLDGKTVEILADFCAYASHTVILMDANGDGKTDILCHMDDKRACLRLSTL